MKIRRVVQQLIGASLFAVVTAVHASTISVNFVGSATTGGVLSATDLAGNAAVGGSFVANWNNAYGASGSGISLSDNLGSSTNVGLAYSTKLGTWALPITTGGTNIAGGANPTMMRGYLDADENGSTVVLSGLSSYFSNYRILLYFDGNNEWKWRAGEYTITDTIQNTQLFTASGEDSENVDFNSGLTGTNNANGIFQTPVAYGAGNQAWPHSPNNAEGNFFITSALDADSITIRSMGIGGSTTTKRAPLNGFQIIGDPISVPEPATGLLLGIGIFGLFAARKARQSLA